MAYINNVRRIIINLEKETYFADSPETAIKLKKRQLCQHWDANTSVPINS